jgi:hypothetical protein
MKELDRWAREFGYNDFDTFMRTNANIEEARRDIRQRIRWLHNALDAIEEREPPAAEQAATIVDRIRPLLAGHDPDIQGAVLADLLAIWLAGHHVEGDKDATRKLRAELLAEHCTAVRQFTSVNAKIIGTMP